MDKGKRINVAKADFCAVGAVGSVAGLKLLMQRLRDSKAEWDFGFGGRQSVSWLPRVWVWVFITRGGVVRKSATGCRPCETCFRASLTACILPFVCSILLCRSFFFSSRMAPLKLYYFDMAGLAESIRLTFTLGDVDFIDERLSYDTFLEMKNVGMWPTGKLPVLEVRKPFRVPHFHSQWPMIAYDRVCISVCLLKIPLELELEAADPVLCAFLPAGEVH